MDKDVWLSPGFMRQARRCGAGEEASAPVAREQEGPKQMLQLSEKYSIKGTVKCANCEKKIVMGEKYIHITHDDRIAYLNLCTDCLNEVGAQFDKAREDIKEYNDIVLGLPEEQRKSKFKMARKIQDSK